jgi:hypothetical protein
MRRSQQKVDNFGLIDGIFVPNVEGNMQFDSVTLPFYHGVDRPLMIDEEDGNLKTFRKRCNHHLYVNGLLLMNI